MQLQERAKFCQNEKLGNNTPCKAEATLTTRLSAAPSPPTTHTVKTSQKVSPRTTVAPSVTEPSSPNPEHDGPSHLNTDFATMSKVDAAIAEALTTTEVVNDGLAIAALCDSCENLGTCVS